MLCQRGSRKSIATEPMGLRRRLSEGDGVAKEIDESAIPKTESRRREPEPAEVEQLERAVRSLQARVLDLEKNLDNARREAAKAQWSVRLLRNVTARLLAPFLLVGCASFLLGWLQADNWDYALIGGAAIGFETSGGIWMK
eukprot:Opistho-1_new@3405